MNSDERDVVYMDHAATSPLRPSALAAMMPWLDGLYGNPSGAHFVARRAKRAIEDARDHIAGVIGRHPLELVFTSGGTEANNHVVRAAARSARGRIVVSAVEHHAVLEPAHDLDASVVAVDSDGRVDLAALQASLVGDVALVSVMAANNETGVLQPLADVARIVRRHAPTAWLHTDAVQAAPWLDVSELAENVDSMSVSAHKLGGPQGVGLLVVPRGLRIPPLLLGGGQEREMRSGTHNVAGIIGFAAAFVEAASERAATSAAVGALRDTLERSILERVDGVRRTLNANVERLPNNSHLCFAGIESESLVFLLDRAGVCASAASACSSGGVVVSHVLQAMGVPHEWAAGALRLTLGPQTSEREVRRTVESVAGAVDQLREAGS